MASPMYTGMNSGTLRVKQQRAVVKIEKEITKAAVLPGYDQLIKDLDKEIKRVLNIDTIVDGTYVPEDEVRFELAARKRYVDFIRGLRGKYERAVKDER